MSTRFSTVFDLLVVLVSLGSATAVVLLEPFGGGALRTALVLPVLLFVPGYALISFLYPDRPADPATRDREGWSLTPLERVGLAVAASVGVVPLIALVSNFTPLGVRPRPILGGVVAVTALLTLGALIRRLRLDPERRFRAPVLSWVGGTLSTFFTRSRATGRQRTPFEAQTNRHLVLNVLVAGAALLLVASVAYAAVGPTLPSQDGAYTELYLLDGDGQYLLGTEDEVPVNEDVPAVIAVENHERTETTYSVVIKRQQMDGTAVGTASTVETLQRTVAPGDTAEIERTFQGGGEQLRVQVLLFKGDPPENPSADNAYRVTRFSPGGSPADSGGN